MAEINEQPIHLPFSQTLYSGLSALRRRQVASGAGHRSGSPSWRRDNDGVTIASLVQQQVHLPWARSRRSWTDWCGDQCHDKQVRRGPGGAPDRPDRPGQAGHLPRQCGHRELACHLAARVFEQAVEENQINNKTMLENYDKLGVSGLKDYIYSKMWNP